MTLDTSGALLRLRLDPDPPGGSDHDGQWLHPGAPIEHRAADHARAVAEEILAYLGGRLKRFDLPWRLPDALSPFRRAVLVTVSAIPFGETLSYGEVAAIVGSPGAARAVGGAMAANPLPLVIPCHRVVAAGDRLGGFSSGLGCKRALLAHEGQRSSNW